MHYRDDRTTDFRAVGLDDRDYIAGRKPADNSVSVSLVLLGSAILEPEFAI